jgi:molybdopterin-binding protein
MTLSARNHLLGTIDEIEWGDVVVRVTVRVGDHSIESVITRKSAEEMARKKATRSPGRQSHGSHAGEG